MVDLLLEFPFHYRIHRAMLALNGRNILRSNLMLDEIRVPVLVALAEEVAEFSEQGQRGVQRGRRLEARGLLQLELLNKPFV